MVVILKLLKEAVASLVMVLVLLVDVVLPVLLKVEVLYRGTGKAPGSGCDHLSYSHSYSDMDNMRTTTEMSEWV